MKCPQCNTDGAYQPLLTQLECVNSSCSFYVRPKSEDSKLLCSGKFPIKLGRDASDVNDVSTKDISYYTKKVYDLKYKTHVSNPCKEIPFCSDNMIMVDKDVLKGLFITQTIWEWDNFHNNTHVRFVVDGLFYDVEKLKEVRKLLGELFNNS